ncbi:MAG: hypothetical protein QW797_08770 [Thermoproteota archaeon]
MSRRPSTRWRKGFKEILENNSGSGEDWMLDGFSQYHVSQPCLDSEPITMYSLILSKI